MQKENVVIKIRSMLKIVCGCVEGEGVYIKWIIDRKRNKIQINRRKKSR